MVFQVVLNGKSSQEYPVNAGFPQDSILVLILFLLYINELPDNFSVTLLSIADGTKCDQVSGLW